MSDKTVELNYTPELNRKIIHKIGVPGDNLPENLMQFMCKHYDNSNIIEGKRILVIRMLDLAKQYAIKNSVTYITDNPEKYDEFLKAINNEQKYGGDDEVYFIENWKNIGELIDMSKFDIAIMNPPWDIHLKIIENVLTSVDNVVNISPIRWLQDPLATYKKNSDYNKFENTISKKIKDIEVIDSAEIDKMFGIQYNTTVAVYHFDKNGGYDYASLMDSKSKIYRQIYKDVMKNSSSCPELKLYKDSKKKNFVPVCLLSGHIDALNAGPTFSRDRYRFFVDNKCVNPIRKDVNGLTPEKAKSYNLKTFDNVIVADFDTAEECSNFYDYITSPFFVYMCKCHSMDGHVTPKYLPFMKDYKTKKTNDEIFDYFKVSEKNKTIIFQELKRLK